MKALCWFGKRDIRLEEVDEPKILNPRDAVLKVSRASIGGADLHLYEGFVPAMERGDILGHEFVGEIVDVGPDVETLDIGDRVAVPFPIACGDCHYCHRDRYALCDNSNPNAWMAEQAFGYSPAGIFGYSHLFGGYAGGQAEYVRIPFADVGPRAIPGEVSDDQALMCTDVFPTGYQAAAIADFEPGATVAVWGCGPVGLFAIKSAYMMGADRVIAIDRIHHRLTVAHGECGAEILHLDQDSVLASIEEMTGGRGPDVCIEAVGMEAHGGGAVNWMDRAKHSVGLDSGRSHALRQAIMACAKAGTIVVPGVFGGSIDNLPMGAAFNKGLTFKMGQTDVHRHLDTLFKKTLSGDIDPGFVISHRAPLVEGPAAYEWLQNEEDDALKIALTP